MVKNTSEFENMGFTYRFEANNTFKNPVIWGLSTISP